MDRFSRLCLRFFGGHRGFSIGIDDVAPSEELLALKRAILLEGCTNAICEGIHCKFVWKKITTGQ
jgi:DNA-directed RNA polymerase III subunit RPC1